MQYTERAKGSWVDSLSLSKFTANFPHMQCSTLLSTVVIIENERIVEGLAGLPVGRQRGGCITRQKIRNKKIICQIDQTPWPVGPIINFRLFYKLPVSPFARWIRHPTLRQATRYVSLLPFYFCRKFEKLAPPRQEFLETALIKS